MNTKITEQVVIHLFAIIGIIIYFFNTALLYPEKHLADIILILLIPSVFGLFIAYVKPRIAMYSFLITIIGTPASLLIYILKEGQRYNIKILILSSLLFSCTLLYIPFSLLKDKVKNIT